MGVIAGPVNNILSQNANSTITLLWIMSFEDEKDEEKKDDLDFDFELPDLGLDDK